MNKLYGLAPFPDEYNDLKLGQIILTFTDDGKISCHKFMCEDINLPAAIEAVVVLHKKLLADLTRRYKEDPENYKKLFDDYGERMKKLSTAPD